MNVTDRQFFARYVKDEASRNGYRLALDASENGIGEQEERQQEFSLTLPWSLQERKYRLTLRIELVSE